MKKNETFSSFIRIIYRKNIKQQHKMKRLEINFECESREMAIKALEEIIERMEKGFDCGEFTESGVDGDWGLIDENSNLW